MRKYTTLTLNGAGTQASMLRGSLRTPKGQLAPGITLKCTFPIANASGGSKTLSDAEKQTLLSRFSIVELSYGAGSTRRNLFAARTFARIHAEMRRAYQSEAEGYTDTVNGLQKAMADAQTHNLVLYLTIPTGKFRALEEQAGLINKLGMGKSQLETVALTIEQTSAAVATGVTIANGATFVVMPDLKPCRGDVYYVVPEYKEHDEPTEQAVLPDGFPLAVSLRNSVQASTTVTNFSLQVDGAVVHDQVNPSEALVPVADDPGLPSAGLMTDRETILYAITNGMRMRDLPTGRVLFRQNVKDLATAQLSFVIVPLASSEAWKNEVEALAKDVRRKTVKVVSMADVEGLDVPDNFKPFLPFIVFDQDDAEFERFSGLAAAPGEEAKIVVPQTVAARAKAQIAEHEANGENRAAAKVLKRVASAIPGAITNGRGFARGSEALKAVESLIR